ncbi:unnamed protein product [Bursaphelenchus xylophilus]|uniref:(pine wood nematode) hypothetical protein n=1 Tax=Bursaphelenchus xylophilus TaxID=6326 RepID=A0A1I7S6X2_BURXY|nr:unnamed protein product [Bursaphelenchus xylophilus]CAD5232517.1 unnamed protein product [Bursaphelenchus xylophilus]CAG9079648.1 unnamed protein product [Bursaphelenchus xylophilus]CAG9125105.1 unnamed protein product [Bursaphelenchus xylophilus]
MENLENNLEFLRRLSRVKSGDRRRKLVAQLDRAELEFLVEICYNLVKGEIPLTKRQKSNLLPLVGLVREVARKRSVASARRVLQEGAGLPLSPVLIPAISFLAELLLRRS